MYILGDQRPAPGADVVLETSMRESGPVSEKQFKSLREESSTSAWYNLRVFMATGAWRKKAGAARVRAAPALDNGAEEGTRTPMSVMLASPSS